MPETTKSARAMPGSSADGSTRNMVAGVSSSPLFFHAACYTNCVNDTFDGAARMRQVVAVGRVPRGGFEPPLADPKSASLNPNNSDTKGVEGGEVPPFPASYGFKSVTNGDIPLPFCLSSSRTVAAASHSTSEAAA